MRTHRKKRRRGRPTPARKKAKRPTSNKHRADSFQHFEAKRASKEAVVLLSLVNPSGGYLPHLIADDFNRTGDFKGYEELIRRAAEQGRKQFFIDLGKLLEGKRLNTNLWSKLDWDTAFILCLKPKIKTRDALAWLRQQGHAESSQLAFKQKKYNWKKAANRTRDLWNERRPQIKIYNSFLDGEEE